MSGEDRQQQRWIRTVALGDCEKRELTRRLRDLELCPQNGKVVLHFNGGAVIKVEPQPVL